MYQLIGTIIVLTYAALLFGVYKVSQKKTDMGSLHSFIFVEQKASTHLLAPSIFSSWVWPTTIIGAAEAGIRYGLSGGIAYALGAGIGFLFLTLMLIRFHKLMPGTPFITEFVGKRFSEKAKTLYFILVVLIAIYLVVEMAAGIGFVFSGIFGVSFKLITFSSVLIATVFVINCGTRGVLYNDLVNFFIIVTTFAVIAFLILSKFDIQYLYQGLIDVQINPANNNYNPEIFNYLASGGLRYFLSAIIVGFAQTCIDPSYSLRAYIATDEKSFRESFILGGVILFMPVAIISSIILGYTVLAMNFNLDGIVNLSTVISSKMFLEQFPLWISVLFAFMMFAITMTTIISGLMGILGIATFSIYSERIAANAKEKDKLVFGRVFIAIIGFICALIGISLESISLLTLDTFCGILFAAPCGVLVMGLISKKIFGNLSIIALILGVGIGFCVWLLEVDSGISWFYGTLLSFSCPIIFLWLFGRINGKDFNMISLRW
jgi:Na+/proline symporter